MDFSIQTRPLNEYKEWGALMKPQHLLIDGYNLLGKLKGGKGMSDVHFTQDRDAMIQRLSLYAQGGGGAVTVVFDAWKQKGHGRQTVHHAGVTVIYSEAGETADQVIQQLVRSGGKEIAVVSSDHEILSVAKSHGAFTIRSDEFAHRLLRPSRSGLSALGSRVSPRDEEDGPVRPQKEKKGNPRKLPKKVRQRNRLMRGF